MWSSRAQQAQHLVFVKSAGLVSACSWPRAFRCFSTFGYVARVLDAIEMPRFFQDYFRDSSVRAEQSRKRQVRRQKEEDRVAAVQNEPNLACFPSKQFFLVDLSASVTCLSGTWSHLFRKSASVGQATLQPGSTRPGPLTQGLLFWLLARCTNAVMVLTWIFLK